MRQLGQLEAAVMQRLWESPEPMSVRAVLEDLGRERTLAYTTVMTVLDNLHGKRLVERRKEGRAYVYVSRLTREQYTAALMDDALSTTTDRGAALLHFVGQLDESELAQLREALADDGSGS